MKAFFLTILQVPIATLMVIAGFIFLFIFTGGRVDRYGRVDTSRVDEQSSATVGVFLLAMGLIISVIQLNIKNDMTYDHLLTTPPPCRLETSATPARVPTTHGEGLYNLSLLRESTVNASSVTDQDPGKYQLSHLNDGWYNSCRSWMPENFPAWFTVDLGKDYRIISFAIGSDHANLFKDGAIDSFEVFVSMEKSKERWVRVFSYTNKAMPLTYSTHFKINPVNGRYVKVVFNEINKGSLQVDEIEIYGRQLKPWEMIRF